MNSTPSAEPLFTQETINEVLEHLGYARHSRNMAYLKALLSHAGQDGGYGSQSMDSDLLVQAIWDTTAPDKLRSKRKNLSTIRNSINRDLSRLFAEGKNPSGITISPEHALEISQEAKEALYAPFVNHFNPSDISDIEKASALLEALADMAEKKGKDLEDSEALAEKLKRAVAALEKDYPEEVVDKDNEDVKDTQEILDEDELEEVDDAQEILDEDELEEVDDAQEILDEDELEEVEDAQEVLDEDELEEVDDAEEILDEDELEEIEDAEEILDEDELEEIEGAQEILDEDELEEVEGAEEILDEDELEEVEDAEEILDEDELEEVEGAEEILDEDELEEVEGAQEILDEDELEEVDDAEEILDEDEFEEVEGAEEILDEDELEEVDDAEEILDEDEFEEIEGAEEILDEDEFEEVEGAEEILDEDELEEVADEDPDAMQERSEHFETLLNESERYYNRYIHIPADRYPVIDPVTGQETHAEVEAFIVGKYPVTNALFEVFISRTGYKTTAEEKGFGAVYAPRLTRQSNGRGVSLSTSKGLRLIRGANWHKPFGPHSSVHTCAHHPVVQVSYEDAMAFASWTGKRLPTLAQWLAAGGKAATPFPWGEAWASHLCNTEEVGAGGTLPVDTFPKGASPFGVYDLLGNTLEWVCDALPDKGGETVKAAAGGSFLSDRTLTRQQLSTFDTRFSSNTLGFRCIGW